MRLKTALRERGDTIESSEVPTVVNPIDPEPHGGLLCFMSRRPYSTKQKSQPEDKRKMRTAPLIAVILLPLIAVTPTSQASEYLGNNRRSGYADAAVPAKPALRWTYQQRQPPKTAWPEPFGELQFIDFDYAD